jgi:hypothetical protein
MSSSTQYTIYYTELNTFGSYELFILTHFLDIQLILYTDNIQQE